MEKSGGWNSTRKPIVTIFFLSFYHRNYGRSVFGLHCIDWGVGFTVIEYPSFQGPDLFDRRVPGNHKLMQNLCVSKVLLNFGCTQSLISSPTRSISISHHVLMKHRCLGGSDWNDIKSNRGRMSKLGWLARWTLSWTQKSLWKLHPSTRCQRQAWGCGAQGGASHWITAQILSFPVELKLLDLL